MTNNNNNLENLKATPIADYVRTYGHDVAGRRNIVAFWRGECNASVSIDHVKNVWYDHGTGEGGSVLDLVMRVEGCDFAEACRKLERFSFHRSYTPIARNEEPRESGIVIDDVKELQHPALLEYLEERCIPVEIARKYCKQVHYHLRHTPGKRYFAIGFPNDKGGWELRNRFFKGATNKATTYIQNYGSALIIFEGFMDFLSYLAMPEGVLPSTPKADYLILNSVANSDKAVELHNRIREQMEEYEVEGKPFYKVFYACDNDLAGKDVTFKMSKLDGLRGYGEDGGVVDFCDTLRAYSGYLKEGKIEDLNDLLIAVKSIEKKQRGGVGGGC
uniref:toprim domain-containing protein n=1 Tax=Alistipes sp. TaxID=1872444 RepID=UPI004057018F